MNTQAISTSQQSSNHNGHWPAIDNELLTSENYQEIAQCYERLLENEPDNISLYWYLGLTYLFLKEEEQAQLTWFVALNSTDGEELEGYIDELISILDCEGDRQASLENHEKAWLIRGHAREIQPDNLNNLLKLIYLDLKIGNEVFIKFDEWQVIEYLENPENEVNDDELMRCLDTVTKFPTLESVNFARAVLKRSQNGEKFVYKLLANAGIVGFDHRYPIFAADLTRVCIEQAPDNLILYHTLFWFYTTAYHYDEAIAVADEFWQRSEILIHKIYGSFYYLYIYLLRSDWLKVIEAAEQYTYYLELLSRANFEEECKLVQKDFTLGSFITLSQLVIYIRDTPKENRHLNNLVARIFQENCTANHPLRDVPYTNTLKHNRPLKIGYIGHTFRNHSVGWLCRWLIQHRDKTQFQVYLYSLVSHGCDTMREWFQDNADKCHILMRDVEAAVKQIREDNIDILVDLDSLTLTNTCCVMALKPAPIQITWLGQDASGIPAIDYFIADPYVLPPEAESYYSEKIWRLPCTYLGVDGFEIGVPTLRREGLKIPDDAIIYMNFQGALKRYPDTIRLQFKIVNQVPNSYFLIKGSGDQETSKALYTQLAEEAEFSLERVRFLERDKTEYEHRANLQLADVVLDTYPYNGATTTLEVLWSEIPLVTKVGKQFAARNSYTFMMNAGITEGIAWTDEEYVEWGIKLGTDENLRKQISWKLRQSKKTSPLWNGKQFARDMEDAYRQMWEIYVEQNQTKDTSI